MILKLSCVIWLYITTSVIHFDVLFLFLNIKFHIWSSWNSCSTNLYQNQMFPFNSIVIFLCSLSWIIISQFYFCARKLIYYVICGIGHHVKIYGNNNSNKSVTGGDRLPRSKAVKRKGKLSEEISFANGLKCIEQPVCFCSMLSSSFILRTSVWRCLMTIMSRRKAKPAGESLERLSFKKSVSALFEVSAKRSFFPFCFYEFMPATN